MPVSLISVFVLVIACFAAAVYASDPSYTASFQAGGADGYFMVKLSPIGYGVYEYLLDMTNYTTTCDLSAGLTYHFHTYWTDSERVSTTSCASAGGHYDPYLACGTSSEDKAGLCVSLSRTVDQGYTYSCNPTNYAAGHHALCEVGDISGKFGRMMPDASTKVFKGQLHDPNPPLAASYGTSDLVAKQWSSVVVHCPADNARLICALLIQNKCSGGSC